MAKFQATRTERRGSRGMGLSSVLLVVFIILKLTNNIAWSWLWVLSPLWIPLVLLGVCVVAMALLPRSK